MNRQRYQTTRPVREACKKIASFLFLVAIGVMLLDSWWFA